MSCERLGELSLKVAMSLKTDHPDRTELLQLPARFHCECPTTFQTHTGRILYREKPPITADEVPDFLRKVPRAVELFIGHNIYEKALR